MTPQPPLSHLIAQYLALIGTGALLVRIGLSLLGRWLTGGAL